MYGESNMEYTVIEGMNRPDIIRKVNAKIKEGWKPEGGIAFSKESVSPSLNSHFFQAMIKE